MYSMPERKRGRPPPINIASYEKTTIDGAPTVIDESRLSVNPAGPNKAIGLSTSRPASPMHHLSRTPSSRGKKSHD